MAQRRMFSQKIVGSDDFLDMGVSARELYFQLGMYADDDGFITPKRIMRMVGASEDDLRVLLAKRFLLVCEEGVIVIKHWKTNNYIQKDRYQKTRYEQQVKNLSFNENGDYTDRKRKQITEEVYIKETESIQNVYKSDTQVRLGKVNTVSTNVDKSKLNEQVRQVYDHYLSVFNKNGNQYKLTDKRKKKIQARLKDSSYEMILKAIDSVASSSWHNGDNDRGWSADLDFIIRSYEQVEKWASEASKQVTYKADW